MTTETPGPTQQEIQQVASLFYSGRLDEGVLLARGMTERFPGHAIGWLALGTLLGQQGRCEEALMPLREASRLGPGNPETHCNLGIILKTLGRLDETERHLRQALAIRPDYVEACWNLSLTLLRQGKWAEGWPLYEIRHHPAMAIRESPLPPASADAPLPPIWQGEALADKSILVWPEQGLGDEIQFVRYLPLLRARGARHITLACKPPLLPFLAAQGLADRVIGVDAWNPAMSRGFDCWIHLLSLPLRFASTLATLPATLPYLTAEPERVSRWRERLPPAGLRIGLVWKGNPGHRNDAFRSLPSLAALTPLWSIPGIAFVSLQAGAPISQLADQPLLDLGASLRDFADTAAVVSQLDLVICVDTAITHLAGALNVPCWVLLPFRDTDWRWLQQREDSPWYPGALRLFRQRIDGDWAGVVSDISNALKLYPRRELDNEA